MSSKMDSIKKAVMKWGRKYNWNFETFECSVYNTVEMKSEPELIIWIPNYSSKLSFLAGEFTNDNGDKNSEILDGKLSQFVSKYKQDVGFL